MTKKLLVFILIFGLTMAEEEPYKPRGWRPNGRSFNPGRLRSYGPPVPSNTYGPQNGIEFPPGNELPDLPIAATGITTTTTSTTTEIPTTTTTTTTPRTREPTTPFEDELESGPALAVANSFAFNRPVYVYNSFPYYSAYTVLK